MGSNQLIVDEEISNVHVNKVFGISKVAKSNSYKDLNDIPKTFPPKEHSNSHPTVSETTNGMMTPEMKTKLNGITGFHTLRVKYIVEEQDKSKGYTNLDVSLELSDLTISSDTMSELEVKDADKVIKIIGTSLDPNVYKPIQGDKGNKGDIGNTGYWWKPSIDSNGFITWSLVKTDVTDGFTLNITGTKGLTGNKGYDGANVFFENVLNNTYTENFNLRLRGQMVQFSKANNSDSLNFYMNFKVLDDNMSIISKKFQLDYYKKLYGENAPLYLYCVQDENFYRFDYASNSYITYDGYSFDSMFTYNSFIYDKILDDFMYVCINNRFIGV